MKELTDAEFESILAWFMCSDPWPSDDEHRERIKHILNKESQRRGYDDWIVAYHEIPKERTQ